MSPIKIGFLSPYSSIFPAINQQLVEGFVLPFTEGFRGEKTFEFIPEYVAQGGTKAVEEALKKLLHFHHVDVLSGLVSYQVLPQLIPLIEARKKLAFFFDFGEYLPNDNLVSPRVFLNSFQLWQAEFALGKWAHGEFGDKGLVLMPLYESGYQMHAAFRQGTISAGSAAIDYHMLPYLEGQSQVSHHLDHLFDHLRKSPPAFLHAIFSGTEATEFMARFFQSGLQHTIPLVTGPLMAQEEWLEPVLHLGGSFYTASAWNVNSTEKANLHFVQAFRNAAGRNPGLPELLGYEMGLVFKQLLPELRRRDWDAVQKLLQAETLQSPRGLINFWPESGFVPPVIAIEKISFNKRGISRVAVGGGAGTLYNSPAFSDIHQETKTGWQNPYLCV